MNTPAGVLDAQLQSLLELLERHRETRCRAIREQAEEKRRELLAQAHGEARQRMHRAIAAERQRTEAELTAARAQLQTRARQRQYRIALSLLETGWEQIRQAVRERWHDPQARGQWVRALVDEALVVLPRSRWRIEHPTDWDPAELSEEMARVREGCGSEPELAARTDLQAGLRFCTDGACLDGSADGLLADRTGVEAQLLAELHALLGRDALSGPPGPIPEPEEGSNE